MEGRFVRMPKVALALAVAALGAWGIPLSGFGATLTGLDFKQVGNAGQLEIKTDAPVTFEKNENSADKQVVIEVKGAALSKKFERPIDTSSFNSNVLLISPYPTQGDPNSFRVVVQLREPGSMTVTQDGNVIRAVAANGDAAAAQAQAANPPAAGGGEAQPAASADSSPGAGTGGNAEAAAAPAQPSGADASASGAGASSASQFMENQTTKRFTGRPVTIQVRDADVTDVLRLMSEASGFNIVVGTDVQGKITLDLVDVPWDQALDVVLHTMKLGAERNNNILRVVTLQSLTQEKQQEIAAQAAQKASAPRVTKIFQISYADPAALVGVLQPLLAGAATGTEGGTANQATVMQVDGRTNSLIIRDLPENVEKAKRLIEILDTQTPQVLIEAKVVEATETFAKGIAGRLGVGGQGSNNWFASFNAANPVDPLFGSPGVFSDGNGAASPTDAGRFGFSPSLSFLPGVSRLNAILNLSEQESQIRVISSPKLVAQNNQSASIIQGTPVALPPQIFQSAAGTTTSVQIASANLSLNVTPHVNTEGSVSLNVSFERDVPFDLGGGTNAVANRTLNTNVLVESGSTLVMGGIYSSRTSHSSGGFPILRKIPLIGALFGNEGDSTDRSELFFFITPRVLNPKEAGLAGT